MEEPSETIRSAQASHLEAQWVVGFVDGEGCFYIGINPHPEMSSGYQILPEFTVVQHQRDIQVLYALKKFFDCGVVRPNHGDRMAYRVRGLNHFMERIIPFFDQHSLKTKKKLDYLKFRKVILLIKNGEHLKPEGIQRIRAIASKMNRGALKIESSALETE